MAYEGVGARQIERAQAVEKGVQLGARREERRVEFIVVKGDSEPAAATPTSPAPASTEAPHADQTPPIAPPSKKWAVVIAPKGTAVFRTKGKQHLENVGTGWRAEFIRLSGPWAEVRLEDGSTGWIHGNDIRLEP